VGRAGFLGSPSAGQESEVAFDLEINEQTIYWLRQDPIDRGREPGLTTPERADFVSPNAGSLGTTTAGAS
jgi:hypothetical protein